MKITSLYKLKIQLPDAKQKTSNTIARTLAGAISEPLFARADRGTVSVLGPDTRPEDALVQLEKYAKLLSQTYPALKVQVWKL